MLASVLKPVDETRMLEKIGATLHNSGEYEVTIIGYPSTSEVKHQGIQTYSLPAFKRFSWARLMAPWAIFKKINQVKPDVIIINTPELLFIAALNRILFGRKIIYDVLENYYRNLRFTQTFSQLIRWKLAHIVRLTEVLTSPIIRHYFLAEKGYTQELGFANPYTVLENKLPKSVATQNENKGTGYSKLIFTGTLATTTGVFEAIHLCKELHKIDSTFSLTIIGNSAQPEVLSELKKSIQTSSFINLIGGDRLVPHAEILEEISKADVGVIIYPPNPSTESSRPTKLYEYLALKIPILIRHNQESHELVRNCQAGIILNENPDVTQLAQELKSKRLNSTLPDSIFWETEGEKLLNSLKMI